MELNSMERNTVAILLRKVAGADLTEDDIDNLLILARAAGWSQTSNCKVAAWADHMRLRYEMQSDPQL